MMYVNNAKDLEDYGWDALVIAASGMPYAWVPYQGGPAWMYYGDWESDTLTSEQVLDGGEALLIFRDESPWPDKGKLLIRAEVIDKTLN